MVINKIKVECVAVLEPKDHSPVSAHSHAPEPFQFSLQRMQPPAWEQPNFLRVRRLVDGQQNVGDFLHLRRWEISSVPAFVQAPQASVPDRVNTHLISSSPVARQASIRMLNRDGTCDAAASASPVAYTQIS